MVDFRAVSRDHVLSAMDEYDDVGGHHLVDLHAAGQDRPTLRVGGRSYDLGAVAGVAYMRATTQAVSPALLLHGPRGAVAVLRDLGFLVEGYVEPAPQTPARATRAPRTSAAPRAPRAARPTRAEPVAPKPVAVCPTCFLALPATGVCDECD